MRKTWYEEQLEKEYKQYIINQASRYTLCIGDLSMYNYLNQYPLLPEDCINKKKLLLI